MQSLSQEGIVFYIPETNEYIYAYMRRPNWGVGNDTPEVSLTPDLMRATVNPEHRVRSEILRQHPTVKTLRVKVTRSVEILTEELNFNLEPQ